MRSLPSFFSCCHWRWFSGHKTGGTATKLNYHLKLQLCRNSCALPWHQLCHFIWKIVWVILQNDFLEKLHNYLNIYIYRFSLFSDEKVKFRQHHYPETQVIHRDVSRQSAPGISKQVSSANCSYGCTS